MMHLRRGAAQWPSLAATDYEVCGYSAGVYSLAFYFFAVLPGSFTASYLSNSTFHNSPFTRSTRRI